MASSASMTQPSVTTAAVAAVTPAAVPKAAPSRRRFIVIGVVLALAIGGGSYWHYSQGYQDTDDAQIDGSISNVHVAKSSGSERLDSAAVSCVSSKWRNTPAMQGDTPVASPGHQAIVRYSLHN